MYLRKKCNKRKNEEGNGQQIGCAVRLQIETKLSKTEAKFFFASKRNRGGCFALNRNSRFHMQNEKEMKQNEKEMKQNKIKKQSDRKLKKQSKRNKDK
jgi:hypothetical protein